MKKSKLWLPVLTIAALTVATGAVFADTTGSSTTTSSQQTQSAHHSGKHFQHQRGFGVFGQDQQALLTLLKIDAPTLKQDLQSGKSLADIAQAQGVTEQQVIDLLVNSQSSAIDKAVTAGKLTQAQATKFKANLSTRVKQQVESKHTGAFGKQGPRRGHEGFGFQRQDLTSLATLLKLDTTTLQKDLQAGQSLADIAQAQGVTEQQVIDLLVNAQSANLDKAVTAGKMTQAQATKMKSNLPTFVKHMVEAKHTAGQHQGHWNHNSGTGSTQPQNQVKQ